MRKNLLFRFKHSWTRNQRNSFMYQLIKRKGYTRQDPKRWNNSEDVSDFDGIKLQWQAFLLKAQIDINPIKDNDKIRTTGEFSAYNHGVRHTAWIALQWYHQWFGSTKIQGSNWIPWIIMNCEIWIHFIHDIIKINVCSLHHCIFKQLKTIVLSPKS